jgi:putative ABC transport system permease protein
VQPLATLLEDSLAPRRFNTMLLIVFAGVAMALAAAGVYGVLAYSVARRGREFGVRMAMGARAGQVVSLVLGQGMRLVALGAVIGLVGALGLTRLMTSLLYGISPEDPTTLVGAAVFLAGISLLACAIPAWRATRVDPVTALRSD